MITTTTTTVLMTKTRHVYTTLLISRLSHWINPLGGLPPFTQPMCVTLPLEISLLGCIMVQRTTLPLGERKEKSPCWLVVACVITRWTNTLSFYDGNIFKRKLGYAVIFIELD